MHEISVINWEGITERNFRLDPELNYIKNAIYIYIYHQLKNKHGANAACG